MVLPLGPNQVLERFVRQVCVLGGIDWEACRQRYWSHWTLAQEALEMVERYDGLLTREKESGWYGVEVPDLPGCYSQGQTRDEAIENIREAIALYISDRQDVPPPSEHILDSIEVFIA